jgi:hypothetical protein
MIIPGFQPQWYTLMGVKFTSHTKKLMKLVYEDQQVCVVRHERGVGRVEEKGKK